MIQHSAIVEAGPGTIRRLCCAPSTDADAADLSQTALDAIDDPVALVGDRPMAVDALWEAALRAATRGHCDGMVVIHPSWWPASRAGVVSAAAAAVAGETRTRSSLLTRASRTEPDATTVVEIAERLVAIIANTVTAIPRNAEPQSVARDVAGVVAAMAPAAVLIDTPGTVAGASALAALIADAVRKGGQQAPDILEINDFRFARLAGPAYPATAALSGPVATAPAGAVRSHGRRLSGLAAAAIVVAAAAPTAVTTGRPAAVPPKPVETAPTTFLVEGRVTLSVPATWSAQRVVSGPGSARVQVTSPADPEVALHITQSPVAGETLSAAAERLKRAIDAESTGVFVDFNPSGTSAGRPAVTYREVRPGHHVRWTVLLDGPVRISIGCQSRAGDEDAVRDACEQAVRSAHAIG
ncbi:type VII secretion-associated protein [Mycobacterium mantenii]|uniref:Type VII secretion-associated protein n=1 Tax=Mycobacterium mantenii TaxID=560555 RepID=A0A1X0G399_MYCNT|nr:type VII secretion-associated protein [Mycobacterium mantenii]MCV7244086.1 type VII secretion-associated protein [Mycobacterium mantenii]ORB08503.1 type VII secretion-associated protein [Mycobacterium mantenii]BBY38958.1 type VII secretion-associated protein [Mycobacterium mantenii]